MSSDIQPAVPASTMYPIPPITVRPARVDDADMVRAMCWPTRKVEHIFLLLERAEKLENNRRGLGVVGLWEDTVCSFGLLTLWPRCAEISDLNVNAAFQNRSIGSQIVTYLTEAARQLHVETLEIGVALSNPRALALYRRLAFTDGRIIQLELGSGPEPVMYLYKHLSPGSKAGS